MKTKLQDPETVNMFIRGLTVLDCAVLHKERGPIGASYLMDAEVIGHLDDEGVVFDFSYAKKTIKEVIDDICDHRLLVRKSDVQVLDEQASIISTTYGVNKELHYTCPAQALCVLECDTINKESIQTYLEEQVMKAMPDNVHQVSLVCSDEFLAEEQPTYHYTHGLKQHYGNCQRLLHGHYNKLDIYLDGIKSQNLEEKMAKEWEDVHFTFPENILEEDFIVGQRQTHMKKITLSYEGNQGHFKLQLPGEDVYVMPYETTVENISRHLAERVKKALEPGKTKQKVEVFAYEGIQKGAATSLN